MKKLNFYNYIVLIKNSWQLRINIFFCSVLVLGIFLRLYKLDFYSLWFDEIFFKKDINIKEIASGVYPLILVPWHLLNAFMLDHFRGEFLLRLPSVIMGVISIFSIYYLSRMLFNEKAAIITAFLFSISPFQVYFSQELTPYATVSLLTIMSSYFLLRSLRENRKIFWSGYLISNTINIYLRIPVILFLLAQIIYFCLFRKKYHHLKKTWIIIHILIFILLLPLILLSIKSLAYYSQAENSYPIISTTSLFNSISLIIPIFSIKNFLLGFNAKLIVYLLPLLFSLYILFSEAKKINRNESLLFSFCGLVIPLVLMYFLQPFIYADRYLISSSVFLYMILGNNFSSKKMSYSFIGLMLITVASVLALISYYQNDFSVPLKQRIAVHAKKEYKQAADFVYNNLQKGDMIFHTHPNTTRPFEYYFSLRNPDSLYSNTIYEQRNNSFILRCFNESIRPFFFNTAKVKFIDKSEEIDPLNYKRIWIVFSAHEFRKAIQDNSEGNKVLKWMENNFQYKGSKEFEGIIVKLYARK
jgi:hypothetical protein